MTGVAPPAESSRAAPRAPCAIVALGASAGGVTALDVVLSALPAGFPVPVVVVLHVEAHRKHQLARLFGRHCQLPVVDAEAGAPLTPGHVFVAPPDAHLVVREGRACLNADKPLHFSRPSVDVLFASVAASYGARAIGVVLTGSGRDGAEGLRAIKNAGGVTVVEDPDTAEHRGMPASAIATGAVDLTLPIAEIGPMLTRLVTRTP